MSRQTLFTSLFPEIREDEFVELRCFKPIVGRWWVQSTTELDEIVDKTPNDLYWGVNLRKGRGHGKNENVARIGAVVADVDKKNVPDPLKALENYGLVPSAIVDSGGGLHVYWFLDTAEPDTQEFANARQEFILLGHSDAVHDAARILRVPGTHNLKYGDPRDVTVQVVTPTLRYPRSVFSKCKIDADLRRRMYTGNKEGYPSRSERDFDILIALVNAGWTDEEIFKIALSSPWGDRLRERSNPERLLSRELERVRTKFARGGGTNGTEEFFTRDNALWSVKAQSEKKIATFVFEPEALLEGDATTEDSILGSVVAEGTTHKWEHVQIPRTAFIDRRSLTKKLPVAAWSWLGNDTDVISWLPFIVKRLQEKGVPRLRVVKALGRAGTTWVTSTGVITQTSVCQFAEAGYAYLDRYQEKPDLEYVMKDENEVRSLMQTFLNLLSLVNEPKVTWLILCWVIASFYKPLLGPGGREFPILQVVGTQGSGKTSTLKEIFLPLCGYKTGKSYSCDTTDFVMMALMASVTSIPIFFAEFRPTIANIDRFTRRLRLSYDTGFDARGRPDQTTVTYELCAPLMVDGENSVDEAAIRERSVIVTLHPGSLTEARRNSFELVTKLPLNNLAGWLVQWTLRNPPGLEEAEKLTRRLYKDPMPDRIQRNLVKIVCGYTLVKKIIADLHINVEVPEVDELTAEWLHTVLLGQTGRTSILADELIEDIVNVLAKAQIVTSGGKGIAQGAEPFLWRYENDSTRLSFHLSGALNWWIQYRKQRGLPVLTAPAAKTQLKERHSDIPIPGQYIVEIGTKWSSSGPVHMYTIDLDLAAKSGLDIPSQLKLLVVKGGNG